MQDLILSILKVECFNLFFLHVCWQQDAVGVTSDECRYFVTSDECRYFVTANEGLASSTLAILRCCLNVLYSDLLAYISR
jgi:hypothetical protein